MQRLHLLYSFEYGLALAIIFQEFTVTTRPFQNSSVVLCFNFSFPILLTKIYCYSMYTGQNNTKAAARIHDNMQNGLTLA